MDGVILRKLTRDVNEPGGIYERTKPQLYAHCKMYSRVGNETKSIYMKRSSGRTSMRTARSNKYIRKQRARNCAKSCRMGAHVGARAFFFSGVVVARVAGEIGLRVVRSSNPLLTLDEARIPMLPKHRCAERSPPATAEFGQLLCTK